MHQIFGKSRRVPVLVTVTELRRRTRPIVDLVRKGGTTAFLSLNGKLAAALVPVEDLNHMLTMNHVVEPNTISVEGAE